MSYEIVECGVARWTSLWGDPLVTGLVVMALFLVAAALCAATAVRAEGREKVFWALAAFAALIFAINVHLELHLLPKSVGHCMAKAQGWYRQRGSVRAVLVLAAAVMLLALILTTCWVFWRQLIANLTVTLGFALTGGVQSAKGFGPKGVEKLYDIPVGPFRLPDLPDMVGATLVIIGCVLALRRIRPAQSS